VFKRRREQLNIFICFICIKNYCRLIKAVPYDGENRKNSHRYLSSSSQFVIFNITLILNYKNISIKKLKIVPIKGNDDRMTFSINGASITKFLQRRTN
jgi:hypothetical protein